MRLAFMGTPVFSVPALGELIAAGHDIVAVYSQPPRPAGRGMKQQKSPVHAFAEQQGIIVRTPTNFKSEEERAAFAALDLDVAIVVAYGLILPKAILDAPRHGCLNLHGSLLPRWRGAAPIQRAIMAGDRETGVQVMQMEKGLDTGPILLSETVPIEAEDNAGSLAEKMSHVGAHLLPRALSALERGALQAQPQSQQGIIYADKISSDEARTDWTRPARELDFHIRGLSPFPGAWFELKDDKGKTYRVKALMSRLTDAKSDAAPGTIIGFENELLIATGEGVIALTRLQRAGGKAQEASEFLRGAKLAANSRAL